MPDINEAITLTQESKNIILQIKNSNDYSFRDWSSDSLLSVRKEIRSFYRTQQNGICVYCRNPLTRSPSGCHVEHIAPKSLYIQFMFHPKNLCAICPDCNEIKREKEVADEMEDTLKNDVTNYPRSSNAFKIYHPHFDNYDTHIANIDGYYIDKTEKGANTIRICILNRKLRDFGYHDSVIAKPKHLDLMLRIFHSGKLQQILDILDEDN